MRIHEYRLAKAAWACACVFVSRTAIAAQSTIAEPMPTAITIGSNPTLGPSYAKPPESRAPPAPLPSLDPPAEVPDQGPAESARTYATRGTLELGGFASFSGASNLTSIQVRPTFGWFVLDDLELSVILGMNYVHLTLDAGTPAQQGEQTTIMRALGEPSYHPALGRGVWGFLGVGFGIASAPRGYGREHTGFDIAPRAGASFLVVR